MREVKLFTEWAEGIVNEFSASDNKGDKREKLAVATDRDIARQAQIKYPTYDKEQSLELFIADKLEDMEKRDEQQNKVINAQRRENDNLRRELSTLSSEVDDVADTGKKDHAEVERLRALSGQIKSDIQTKKISQREINDILDQARELNKAGLTNDQYLQIKREVDEFKKGGVDPQKFKEFKSQLDAMGKQRSVDQGDFEKLRAMMARVDQGQENVNRGTEELNRELDKLDRKTKDIENIVRRRVERERGDGKARRMMGKRLDAIEPVVRELEPAIKNIGPVIKDIEPMVKNFEPIRQRLDVIEPVVKDLEPVIRNIEPIRQRLDSIEPVVKKIEPEVRLARTLALDVGDEVDTLSTELENEKENNRKQDQWIEYLWRIKSNREDAPLSPPPKGKTKNRNPYANIDRDELEDIVKILSDKESDKKTTTKESKNSFTQFESILNSMTDTILGSQYSKYLAPTRRTLKEGGNIFKAPDWTRENPQMITSRIARDQVPHTLDYIETLTGIDLQDNLLGSTGIALTSGDIDIAVDADKYPKDQFEAALLEAGVDPDHLVKTGDSLHYMCPIFDENGHTGRFVQVDFMFVPDVPFARWSMRTAPDSEYKGVYLQKLRADLTNTVAPKDPSGKSQWKWNHFKGVLNRSDDSSVFGFDPDRIAQGLLGPRATSDDLESVERILRALKDNQIRKDVVATYRQTLARDQKGKQLPPDEELEK